MASVVLQELTKSFQQSNGASVSAVQNISLVVADKEFFVLVGPSGCGKTTTLRLIAGLEKPTHGSIALDDRVVTEVQPKERDVAMVFQSTALYPHMSAYENMAFGLKLRGCSAEQIRERVLEAASLLELTPFLTSLPQNLSGGQRQRVALGRAIVRRPQVYLFDEPLSNLDPALRLQMRNVIADIHQRLEKTVIYVTHDQVEALSLGHRVGVMKGGLIQQVAAPLVLYQQPSNLFVARFIGTPPMNLFRGILVGSDYKWTFQDRKVTSDSALGISVQISDRAKSGLGQYINKPLIMGLRAEHITYGAAANGPHPEISKVEALVTRIQPLGPEKLVELTSGSSTFIARFKPDAAVEVHQTISLFFDMRAAHFFDATTEQAISHGQLNTLPAT